jgi:hypothetical protein
MKFTTTGSTTLGSKILTNIVSTNNIYMGMRVTGTGIPVNSFIADFVLNSTVTITNNCTVTSTTAVTITFATPIPIVTMGINEVSFIMDYLASRFPEYRLNELTNNVIGDIPSIVGCHPLAMEYGNWKNASAEGQYTSILPAIGVELLNDNEDSKQLMGSGTHNLELTGDYITSIASTSLKNRFNEGVLISPTNITEIQTAKSTKGTEVLWGTKDTYLQQQQIAVTIWSENYQINRILYLITRSLLKRLKHDISKIGFKNMQITGQGALYNYEFNQTLFGSEFTISGINGCFDLYIDDALSTIKHVEETTPVNTNILSKPNFVKIGD